MYNILKYYKNLFILILKLDFAWVESGGWAYEALKEANSDFISASEWKKLKAKYEKKDPKEFKLALEKLYKEGIKTSPEIDKQIDNIIYKWNNDIDKTTNNTQANLSNNKDNIEKLNPFSRRLSLQEPRLKWSDVQALQVYLTNNWFDTNWTEWIFWPGTFRALKKYQKKVLWFRKPDWIMDLNWKTMNYILKDMNSWLSNQEKNKQYWKKANEVVTYLNDTDKYLTAFNKIYWWQGDIISRDNGLLWIVNRLKGSSLTRLTKELKPDYSKIDKNKLSKELWLSQNSEKFKEWLARTAIIAVVSAILTWGSSVALELFWINYWENLSKWPEINKILKALWRWKVDFKKKMKDMYLDKNTTVSWLNAILDVLNNPNMDTANLKRFMKEVYQPNWFQDTFGIFLPKWYKKVEELIKIFEHTSTTQNAKAAVKEIYKLAHNAVMSAKEEYKKAKNEYDSIPKDILEKAKDPFSIMNSYWDDTDAVHDANFTIRRLKSSKKDLQKAIKWLARIWEAASRYTNLDAKRAQIQWEKFNRKEALHIEKKFDKELSKAYGSRKLRKINTKELYSRQSFAYKVDVNKVSDEKYMSQLLTKMNKETINGQTSVLAWLMRWIEQHYGIVFTVEEFTNAFMKTAKKVTNKEVYSYILSNLWRERNQEFQWKINGKLFKITLNGQDIYFKNKCTNIITVVNDLPTTIDTTSSVPIVFWMKTGYHRWWWSNNNWWLNSTPWETETPINNSNPIPNPAVPWTWTATTGGASGWFNW